MAEILAGEFKVNDTNENSRGGTERLTRELAEKLGKETLEDFQIVSSRVRDLAADKIRIFWAHDLPGDPESNFLKDKNLMNRFHLYVFVSNWQMQGYMQQYGIPWSKCVVIRNAIDPIPEHVKPDPKDGINIIYHTTPHRGLNILTAVFDKLCEKHDNINLDVYSSFNLYGWGERDEQYKPVFDKLEEMPRATSHGAVDHATVREALQKSHIFAYPSIWPETSCLSLMEAMSARNMCIHSNYAALPETAACWTEMYQMHEDQSGHANIMYNMLDGVITNYDNLKTRADSQASYANIFYTWEARLNEWRAVLEMLKANIKDRSIPKEQFNYSTN
jgi:glycosyltransferase involved in cell wall biosynthesis